MDKAIEVLGMLLFKYDHATAIPTMVGDSKQRSGIRFLETMMICLVLVDLVPEMIETGCFGGRCWNMVCLSKLDGNIRHDDLDLPTFHGWSAGPDGLYIFLICVLLQLVEVKYDFAMPIGLDHRCVHCTMKKEPFS